MLGTADDVIYLFGDSITQHGYDPATCGWVSLLSHAYQRRMTVVNAGLSGYSSDQALDILPRMLPSHEQANIRLLVVFFGANDARLPGTGELDSPEQHVPKEKYKENLRAIIKHEKVQAHQDLKIVLVTPPPVDEALLSRKNRQAKITAEYAAQARALAKELANEGLEVRCLDLWSIFMQRVGWEYGDLFIGSKEVPHDSENGLATLLGDGLHFNSGGNKLCFQKLMALIMDHWPALYPDALPFVLPVWLDQKEWKGVLAKRSEE